MPPATRRGRELGLVVVLAELDRAPGAEREGRREADEGGAEEKPPPARAGHEIGREAEHRRRHGVRGDDAPGADRQAQGERDEQDAVEFEAEHEAVASLVVNRSEGRPPRRLPSKRGS
jgi:hypothetical protein